MKLRTTIESRERRTAGAQSSTPEPLVGQASSPALVCPASRWANAPTASGTLAGLRQSGRLPHYRAFILVGVLVLVMLLSMLVISLLFRFKAEDTAASASVGTEQAWAAAMSGVEEALRVAADALPGATDWQQNPGAFRDRLVFEDGADRWFFSVFSPGDGESLEGIRFGLTDEAGKLNVNALGDANLEKLPRFTPALAAALRDFIDEDSTPLPEGAEQDYYSGLPRPYTIRNGPLASLDELLLVRGFTPALLHGTPARATGDDAEQARSARGVSQFLTIASSDPDTANDGTYRVNFNSPEAVWPETELPPALTNFLAALRSNDVTLSHAADLLEAVLPVKDGKGLDIEITSGVGKAELAQVLELFTASAELQTAGLINVNTASLAVLATLPGVDDALAESIVSARRSISPERRTTIAWLYAEGVVDAAKFKALAPLLTARSFQFTCQVIGYGQPSGRYRVLEVGLDVAGGTRRVTYLRDVTRRGLPFPLNGEAEAQPAKSANHRPVGQDSVEPQIKRSSVGNKRIGGAGVPFPLTPALSLREREERSPRPASHNATDLRALTDFLPLPEGEGRGEGECRALRTTALHSPPPDFTLARDARFARASFVGKWSSTESRPTKLRKEARRG